MGFTAVVQQVGVLGIAMLIGFLAAKTGYVPVSIKDGISKLIVNILLPCLIVSSITSKEIGSGLWGKMGTMFLLSLFAIAVLFLVGTLLARLFRIPKSTAAVHRVLSTGGNVIFVGQPIVIAMFGPDVFLYYIVYWLLNDLFFWTVGFFLLSQNENTPRKPLWKILCNPNTITFAAAVGMLVAGIRLPGLVQDAFAGIGALTTFLSMLFIGMTLATVSLGDTLKKWWSFLILPTKLILVPLALYLLFRFLGADPLLAGGVTLGAAMPSATVISIVATEVRSDYEYAAVGMFLTTVASLVTLPLVAYGIQLLNATLFAG